MPAAKGSAHRFALIPEVTVGTTPATPTLVETILTNLNIDVTMGSIRSAQIRAHPFLDRLLRGRKGATIEMAGEVQNAVHDPIFEAFFGGAWTANVLKATDTVKGLSGESQHQDLSLFDQLAGIVLNRLELSFSADEEAPVTFTTSGICRTAELDAVATLATAVTAAADEDPFVHGDSTITIAGVSRPVTQFSATMEHTIDPLYVLGSAVAREDVPSDWTVTGSLTVPLEDNVESNRLENFTDAAVLISAQNPAGNKYRRLRLPKIKYTRMGRRVQTRGVLFQEIDWEARYSAADVTAVMMERNAP